MVGEIRGTPTIKFIYPSKKNKRGSNKKKIVSDYNGERKAEALLGYAESYQPNYVTKIFGEKEFDKFNAQAVPERFPPGV